MTRSTNLNLLMGGLDPEDLIGDIADEAGVDNSDRKISKRDRINALQSQIKRVVDDDLRPHTLDEIIGQPEVQRLLPVQMRSAKRRGTPIEHIMLSGPPGLGKTTIASVIAAEMDMEMVSTTGPELKQDELEDMIFRIMSTDVSNADSDNTPILLFVDEAHGLPKDVQNIMLPILEDFRFFDVTIPRFTMVCATTHPHMLLHPFRERFGIRYQLDYYTDTDIAQILERSYKILAHVSEDPADEEHYRDLTGEEKKTLLLLARRSRGVPRVANQLLRRTMDFVWDETPEGWKPKLNKEVFQTAMVTLGIDKYGLNAMDRKILVTLHKRFGGKAGIRALAVAIGEDFASIETVNEPTLVRLGLINRGQGGREITVEGAVLATLADQNKTEF